MSGSLRQLQRLRKLRLAQETLEEAATMRARRAVGEAEAAVAGLRAARDRAREEGLRSLMEGVADEWMIVQQTEAWAAMHEAAQLTELTRRKSVEAAQAERLRGRRMQREQAEMMVDGVRRELEVESERRAQAESDDRFAARRHWALQQRAEA